MSLPDTPFQHFDARFRRMVIDTAQVDRLYHG